MLLAIMRKTAMLLLAVIGFTAFAKAQTVTGTVTDSKGDPLSGISVTIKGTNKGTSTNAQGVYTISGVASGSTLVFTGSGFTAQSVKVTGDGTFSVIMQTAISNLNEVVVVGYGTARKKDLTGAVTSVQAKDFNQGAITSPDQLLQNKVPGVEVTSNSGAPGGGTTVRIRGTSTIRTGSGPLYVVDGVPLDGRSARPFISSNFGGSPEANALLFIDPNTIQSIDILKDASSAAIYGSRGANGVIAITTKQGTSGSTKIEFGTSWSVNAGLMKKYEVLDAGEFRSALAKYNITGQDKGSSVDVFKELLNHKLSQNYSLGFSGGNENGKFRASFLASSTNGTFKNSQLDKYIGTMNGQYKFLDKKLSLGFSLIVGHTNEDVIAVSNTAGSEGNIISSALQWNPTTNFKDASGKWVYPTNGSGNPFSSVGWL